MTLLLLSILLNLQTPILEPTFSNQIGFFIEEVLERNDIVSKYFNQEAFLLGFDRALANEPALISKQDLCKYFDAGITITPGRKALYSQACGHYIVQVLQQKHSKEINFNQIREGIVMAKNMQEPPALSDGVKEKIMLLLEDLNPAEQF